MRIEPLNLISTPVAVLNSLGLRVKVGLSSEDPMVWRHRSQVYYAYLTTYAPDGRFLDRQGLGQIAPRQRRLFDLSDLTQALIPREDHVAVVHRVPAHLLTRALRVPRLRGSRQQELAALQSLIPEEPVELPAHADYSFFRAYLQYEFDGARGGNGSVIYEVPYRFNAARPAGSRAPSTLVFTTKIWLSPRVNSYVVLMNYSTDSDYRHTADYVYGCYSSGGQRVASGRVSVRPFALQCVDLSAAIPMDAQRRAQDPGDGASMFSFVGYCEDAALAVVVLNLDREGGGISVEHTHPAQSYLLPNSFADRYATKSQAVESWKTMLAAEPTP